MEILSVLLLGFALGLKHALEPDHIIAVSTIARHSRSLLHSSLAGVFWGIGHAVTLFVAGIFLIGLKVSFSEKWVLSLEFIVGIMLVYLGLNSLLDFWGKKKELAEKTKSTTRIYWKSTMIGFVHGLAGSGGLVLLTMSTVHSVWEGAIYILVFGGGTIVGMLTFTSIIGIPFVISDKNKKVSRWLAQCAGVASAAFGIYYMYNLGVREGLFKLWVQ